MNNRILATVAAVIVVAGCGSDSATSPISGPSSAPATVLAEPATTSPSTDPTTAPAPERQDTEVAVAVAGGDLPASIIGEQQRVYGNVLDRQTFVDAYQVHGLPYPDGPGVIVIEHQQIVSNISDDGAGRFDSVTYAFRDPRDAAGIIAAFAVTTSLAFTVGDSVDVADGTCTTADERTDAFLTIISCTRNDKTHTLQIVRQRFVPGPTTIPAIVQQHISMNDPIATALDAQFSQWDLRRSADYLGGHAISIDYDTTGTVAVEALGVQLLGWQPFDDYGYGPGFASGDTQWLITDTGLLYSAPGPDTIDI